MIGYDVFIVNKAAGLLAGNPFPNKPIPQGDLDDSARWCFGTLLLLYLLYHRLELGLLPQGRQFRIRKHLTLRVAFC